MINLIPPSAKKSIVKEYWFRVCSTWMYLWAFALVCCTAIVFPAYVLIGSQVDVYEVSAAQASEKVADYQQATVALVRSSQQASSVVNESRVEKFSEYLLLFEGLQGGTIDISQIKISRGVEGIDPVQIIGTAADRQSLASFRDRLLSQQVVSEVDLPIANLARDKDIQFTLTVVLNKQMQL